MRQILPVDLKEMPGLSSRVGNWSSGWVVELLTTRPISPG